jgi:prepilin signal peptidase PulO-like enzyme (type II secretory pathway)
MAKTSSISFPTSVSSMTGIAEVVSFCCAQEQNKETNDCYIFEHILGFYKLFPIFSIVLLVNDCCEE